MKWFFTNKREKVATNIPRSLNQSSNNMGVRIVWCNKGVRIVWVHPSYTSSKDKYPKQGNSAMILNMIEVSENGMISVDIICLKFEERNYSTFRQLLERFFRKTKKQEEEINHSNNIKFLFELKEKQLPF